MNFPRTAYVYCLLCCAIGSQAKGSDLYPLLVTETEGTLSKEASNQMIKSATQSAQSGLAAGKRFVSFPYDARAIVCNRPDWADCVADLII